MPELPEVETVRRGLLASLPGKQITAVKVLRPASVGAPDPLRFAKLLVGHTFNDITRRGKYILFHFDGGATMVAHLRMSGRLLISGHDKARAEHVRVRIVLNGGEELIFEDMRVFGRLWFVPKSQPVEKIVTGLATLGVEPLEKLDSAYLLAAFAKRTQAIKTVLLDQTIIAGIGNIYADEALHLAHIHPRKPAKDLTLPELKVLSKQIIEVLAQAIEMRGSSLRNYTDASGVNGNYQNRAWVYGREGQPCHNCGTEIERIKLAGRSSHFCPNCQPSGKPRRAALKPHTKR
jgi:formamidopyrimidine-DNA glycosylase